MIGTTQCENKGPNIKGRAVSTKKVVDYLKACGTFLLSLQVDHARRGLERSHFYIHRGAERKPVGVESGAAAVFVRYGLNGAEPHVEVVALAGAVSPVLMFHMAVKAVVHGDGEHVKVHCAAQPHESSSLGHAAADLQSILQQVPENHTQLSVGCLLCLHRHVEPDVRVHATLPEQGGVVLDYGVDSPVFAVHLRCSWDGLEQDANIFHLRCIVLTY